MSYTETAASIENQALSEATTRYLLDRVVVLQERVLELEAQLAPQPEPISEDAPESTN